MTKPKTWFVIITLSAHHGGVEQRQTTIHDFKAVDEEECFWAALHFARGMFDPPLPEGAQPITLFYRAVPA